MSKERAHQKNFSSSLTSGSRTARQVTEQVFPDAHIAIVRGKNNTSAIGLVEVYLL
ncbi:MAG: hypothetical protein ACXV97_00915 [Chthoniobacterales bacterium]